MDSPDLERQLQAAQARLNVLRHHGNAASVPAASRLPNAIDEFSTALNDLQAAIDELYQSQAKLHMAHQLALEERRHYQELFEFAPDGYLVTNTAGMIQDANQAITELLKVDRRFLMGKPLITFIAASNRNLFRSRFKYLATARRFTNWEFQLQLRGGQRLPVAIAVSEMRDEHENITGYRWLIRDITAHKPAEATQQKLDAEKELSELKTRFIQTVSHEFRTPLTIIMMATELIDRHQQVLSPEQQHHHLQRIRLSVKEMTHILDRVLMFNRAEAGRLEFNPQLLEIKPFCRELLEIYRMSGEVSQVIEFEVVGECGAAYLDPSLLQHILNNLLSNALKYSPDQSTVYFRLICQPEQVMFQIQDSGIGIPVDDQPRVTQPFHRAKNVDTIPGTGLGLAIAQKAVELHGGNITVESQLQVGSTFTVTLPCHTLYPVKATL